MFSVEQSQKLLRFGFKFGKGGAHAARTMMLSELRRLLYVAGETAARSDFRSAVVDRNVLEKPTVKARKLTFEHLCDLYSLDAHVCLFRVVRRLWYSDQEAQPVLALLIALARDAMLRVSAPVILGAKPGDQIARERMEKLFGEWSENRLSAASMKAIAQRVNGTWTQAGYLTGRVKKIRAAATITPANVTFSLFLAYLEGRLAQRLFSSD